MTLQPEFQNHEKNAQILGARLAAFQKRKGARVGDFIRLNPPDPRCPSFTRITHDHGDHVQTGGLDGSYYFEPGGFCNYSGGLDPGIKTADLIATNETKDGRVWFFDSDIPGTGRGVVSFSIACRVFVPAAGADLDGINELRSPYRLGVTDQQAPRQGYPLPKYCIYKHSMHECAFDTQAALAEWMRDNRLHLDRWELDGGRVGGYALEYGAGGGWPFTAAAQQSQ